jgi:undecaprenyl-diphosphatase
MNFLHALLLGAVEGLTEFLPVSSTGHLILTSRALGLQGDYLQAFLVVIQSGAIAAILWLRRERFLALLPGKPQGPLGGTQGLMNLALCTLPALAIGGLFGHAIKAALFFPGPVALAFIVGALLILFLDRPGRQASRGLTGLDARTCLLIGLAQCLALWPGMSRAACTILGGMLLGLSREDATEFSFLAAVPLLLAATAHDGWEQRHAFAADPLPLLIGWVAAFVVACLAIQGFLRLLKQAGLRPFAWYRLAAAPLFYLLLG